MVYIDDFYKYKKMQKGSMSHMIADTRQELLDIINKLGINPKYIQFKDDWKEHFDISFKKRQLAIELGAIEITYRQLGEKCISKK